MNMQFNKAKWVPRLLFVIALGTSIYWGLKSPSNFTNYSIQVNFITTLIYVYLTYEILRDTRQSRSIPYVNVEFVISSKLDEGFLQSFPELRQSERVKQEIENSKKPEPTPRDLVFICVENIGGTNAIDVKVELKYVKKNLGDNPESRRNFSFGTLKIEEKNMDLVDIYDSPAREDFFQVISCITEHNTVGSKFSYDSPTKKDVSNSVTSKNHDEKVTVLFKRAGD